MPYDPTELQDWEIAEKAEPGMPTPDQWRQKLGLTKDEVIPFGKLSKVDFLKVIERLKNKKLAKETKDRYYENLEQSQKTFVINSMYGALAAPKLNYNYPEGAAEVTRHGRRILKQAILFITGKEYVEEAKGVPRLQCRDEIWRK